MFREILGLIVSVVIIFLSAGALAAARISLCKTKEEKAVFCRGGKSFFLIGGTWLFLAALLSIFVVIGFLIGTEGSEMICLISLPLFAWGDLRFIPYSTALFSGIRRKYARYFGKNIPLRRTFLDEVEKGNHENVVRRSRRA